MGKRKKNKKKSSMPLQIALATETDLAEEVTLKIWFTINVG
jgi:hypothetical protein